MVDNTIAAVAGTAPSQLFLGIENSMRSVSGDHAVCAVTLYSPYWLDNRTGLDLDFQVWLSVLSGAHSSVAPNATHPYPCISESQASAVDGVLQVFRKVSL